MNRSLTKHYHLIMFVRKYKGKLFSDNRLTAIAQPNQSGGKHCRMDNVILVSQNHEYFTLSMDRKTLPTLPI